MHTGHNWSLHNNSTSDDLTITTLCLRCCNCQAGTETYFHNTVDLNSQAYRTLLLFSTASVKSFSVEPLETAPQYCIKATMTTTTTTDTTITNTFSQTNVIAISPTILTDVTTTVTSRIATTLLATEGQTITLTSPIPSPYVAPTTKYTPTTTTLEHTVTLTEIDIYLQNAAGQIYSTWIVPLAPAPPGETTEAPQPSVLIVQPPRNHNDNDDWDNWSQGAKAGLIIGVVLGTLLLLGLIWWCCRRRNIWFAQGWWPWMTQTAPAQPAAPPISVVPHTYVNGPLMPYGYNQPYGYTYAR